MNSNETIKIIQFGEGNFLRGFVDWMVQEMNNKGIFGGKIAVVQPLANGLVHLLEEQNYHYTHILKGIKNGVAVKEHYKNESIALGINPYTDFEGYLNLAKIDSADVIVSNTTEAGITYNGDDRMDNDADVTYPGKLTRLLFERYRYVDGDYSRGYVLLPCELIDKNADKLKENVLKYVELWQLGNDFKAWVLGANTFCNTLVDRIVPGYPRETIEQVWEEIGYKDNLVVESEQFNLWVIEGNEDVKKKFPANEVGCNALFVKDVTPYKMRKVRILNGAHTSLVPVGLLYGVETVKEAMDDNHLSRFLKGAIADDIIPTLTLPEEELKQFADEVIERFENPFVKHYLMSISLNSMSKYRTRVLPSLERYVDMNGVLPDRLVISLAAYIILYRGSYNGMAFDMKDDAYILDLYKELWDNYDGTQAGLEHIVVTILGLDKNWGMDLNTIEGLTSLTLKYVVDILNKGMEKVIV